MDDFLEADMGIITGAARGPTALPTASCTNCCALQVLNSRLEGNRVICVTHLRELNRATRRRYLTVAGQLRTTE
jgi:hypothetical protein